ncbi:nucleoside deaminase [Candidatus Saccharibacteria bacterium]|nr:nucleoside deaminase [Candidatus Saccharibacteria bacterium]
MTDEDYMRLAIEEGKSATNQGNWPIGCVIVLDGLVVAKGHNLVYSTDNRLAHAELIALEAAQPYIFKRLGEAIMYTTYEPCPMCFGAALNARLKKVVYGVDLNGSGAVHLKDQLPELYIGGEYNTEFISGVLADECELLYQEGEVAVLSARQALVNQANNK